jgi:hypothetical protein
VAQVAIGRRERLNVWGNDYDTPDGTGVRDYLHVMDLASGHVSALKLLDSPKCFAVNLGTGAGSSVLEVISAFEAASGKPIPYDIKPRRRGDGHLIYRHSRRGADGLEGNQIAETMCVTGDGRAPIERVCPMQFQLADHGPETASRAGGLLATGLRRPFFPAARWGPSQVARSACITVALSLQATGIGAHERRPSSLFGDCVAKGKQFPCPSRRRSRPDQLR